MLAGENVKLFVENLTETNVAALVGGNCNMLVALLVLLDSKLVGILRVLFNLLPETFDLSFIVL
jgi:hypothetical protein